MDEAAGTGAPARWHVIGGGLKSPCRPCGTHDVEEVSHIAPQRTGARALVHCPPLRLVIIDIDLPGSGPRLSAPERQSVNELTRRGIAVAVATAYAPQKVVGAFDVPGMARPPVIRLVPEHNGAAAPNTSDAAAQMATVVHAARATLPQVAVVATAPLDLPLMLEAGRTIALAGAGRRCQAAADILLPARAQGGLKQALNILATTRD